MPQKEREAVESLTELRQEGNQVIDTRIGESEQVIRFATRNQNIDLTNGEEIRRNSDQMRAFEVDRNGRSVRELSQTEIRHALGLPTGFAYEQQQQDLQNYRSSIQSALDAGDPVLAVQRGFEQWNHTASPLAGQMAGVFKELLGFDIGEMRGSSRENIVALLEEKGIETRVARAPEVREEPRVAVAAPTEDQREADMGLFIGGLNSYRSNAPGVTDESREFALAQSVRAYDTIKGYAPEQTTELENMFRKRTGLGIEEARQQI